MPSVSKSRFNSRGSSLKSSKTTDESSSGIFLIIGLLIILIIVVIVVGAFYKRFEKFTNPKKYRLEYYYMTYCPHCKDFEPIWEKLTNDKKIELNELGVNEFAKYELNGSKKEDIDKVNKYKVTGAPTIILVEIDNEDKYYIYDDNRKVEDIINFIKSKK